MLNKLNVLVLFSLFPLSILAMDHNEKRAQIIAKQDEAYKQSLLTDLKKIWHAKQAQFKTEIEGLQAFLGEIAALESARDNDIERNKQFLNDRLQKNIENNSEKIAQLRNNLQDFIGKHQSSFTDLVTWLHNALNSLEQEQIQDDQFVTIVRPLFDCLTQHGIKAKGKSSASPSASSTLVLAPSRPLNTADPLTIFLWFFYQQMQLSVNDCFFPDIIAEFENDRFKTNGVFDPEKMLQHNKNKAAQFSAFINAGKDAYEHKNYPFAFVVFHVLGSALDLPLQKIEESVYAKSIRAAQAIAQSYLGLIHKNGYGVVANHQEAQKLFQFLDNFLNKKSSSPVGISETIEPFLPICGEAVYEFSRMYQNGEGVEINLCQVLDCLDKAAAFGHRKAVYKLKIAVDNDARAQYTQPGYVKFIKFMEAEEKQLAPEDAHTIAKLFIGRDKKSPYQKITKGYKWLAMAACGGCLDAKYDLAVLLLDLGSFDWGSGNNGLKTSFLTHYFVDSQSAQDEHNASVKVIAFCLLYDAAAQGHVQSATKIVEAFAYRMPAVTLDKPIAWHLKNACARLPLVAKHKFPTLSLASVIENQVLEIFLCCGELPTEMINVILSKIPNFLPKPPKKS